MKKFFCCLFIIAVIVVGGIFLFTNNDALENMKENLDFMLIGIKTKNLEDYNKDFLINDLGKIAYNTYYYDKLDDNQKNIYTHIANAVKNLDEKVLIKFNKEYNFNNVSNDINSAMESFFADHPEVFYLNTEYQILTNSSILGNSVKIYLGYNVDSVDKLNEEIEKVNTGIEKYTLQVKADDSAYQKELQLHDAIAKNVKYYEYNSISEIPEIYHTVYSGIVDKTAVCDGFTKLYQLALEKVSIPSILVTGTLESDPHAWNMVLIEDEWYNVDLTSDKTIKDSEDAVVHSYFNVTNEYIQQSHKFTDINIVPEAKSEKYNYYEVSQKTISASKNFSTQLEDILDSNENEVLVEFRVEKTISEIPEKIVKRLSRRDYKEYLDLQKNTMQYYNILDTYVILKN